MTSNALGRAARAAAALLLAALLLGTPVVASAQQRSERESQPHKVAYFIQWGIYARQYFVKNVAQSGQAARLTTIDYAFGNVTKDGTCASFDTWADFQRPFSAQESVDGVADAPTQTLFGNFNQLRKLKQQFPNLRVLMSLGGFTGSAFFSDAALTPASRQKLVASCIDMFLQGNLPSGTAAGAGVFDGFDLDWEWPGSQANAGNVVRPEDKHNFTLLAAEFRRQLDALGEQMDRHLTLTAFLPANPTTINAGFEVPRIFRFLDWGNMQGYDLHGTWETTTNFQSAVFAPKGDPSPVKFSDDLTVSTYLSMHAPARQLVLGLPFYSRGWTGVPNVNHGLFQTSAGGAAPATFGPGSEDFKRLVGAPGFQLFRDRRAGAAWLFDGTTFWTFDDPVAISEKMSFVRSRGLGGAMAWSLDSDTANASLVRAMDSGLRAHED
jgi:chitinase